MDEELIQQLNLDQLKASLKKMQGELETILKVKATERTDAQKTRLSQLVGDGTDKAPGWIKSVKSRAETLEAEANADDAANQALTGLKSWLDAPANPMQHSGQGGSPGDSSSNGQKAVIEVKENREPIKSMGQLVIECDEFKRAHEAIKSGAVVKIKVGEKEIRKLTGRKDAMKTLMTTSAGYISERRRLDNDIEYMQRPLRVVDLLRVNPNSPYRVSWMEQTTRTNNAATRAEGVALPENAYAWTERTADAVTIGTTLPVTEQQLGSVDRVQGLIDRQLREDLSKKEEDDILNGDATATPPQLTGILLAAGLQTIGVGSDPNEIKIAKAVKKLNTTAGRYRQATACLIHPDDLFTITTAEDDNGNYKLGHPLIDVQRNWQIPMVPSLAMTAGIALVSDFERGCELHRCEEFAVEFGYNADDFGKLRRTARIYVIELLTLYMQNAFCSVNFAAS